jgi:predicted nucleic acid-binding protein
VTTVVLDAGALIGFERSDRAIVAIIARALEHGIELLVPAGVVAQTWRDGGRQARLARLLGSSACTVLPLDDRQARAAGQLCGIAGTSDVVDASVAVAARAHDARVLTSDPDDLRCLDPDLVLVTV